MARNTAWAWWRDRWTPLVIALTVGAFLICSAVALVQSQGDFYGGERTLASVLHGAGELTAPFVLYLVPAAVGLLYAPRHVALVLLAAVALLASQAVVYGGLSVVLPGRYLAVTSIAALVLAAIGFRHMPSRLVLPAAVPLLLMTLSTMTVQHDSAAWWAASTRTFQSSLNAIDAHRGPLIVTGAETYLEPAVSVQRYLAGRPHSDGACGEVIFADGGATGICPTVYVVRWLP